MQSASANESRSSSESSRRIVIQYGPTHTSLMPAVALARATISSTMNQESGGSGEISASFLHRASSSTRSGATSSSGAQAGCVEMMRVPVLDDEQAARTQSREEHVERRACRFEQMGSVVDDEVESTVAELGIDDLAQSRLIRLVDAVVRTHDIGEPTLCDELLQPNDWLLVELERDESARFREQGDQRSAASPRRCRAPRSLPVSGRGTDRRTAPATLKASGRRNARPSSRDRSRVRTPCRPRR